MNYTTRGMFRHCVRAALTLAILASALIVAGPANVAHAQTPALDTVMIVLDVSGSMDEDSGTEPGKSRLDVAKEALGTAVGGLEPGSINLGLRTFADCTSDLIVPVGPADPASFTAAVSAVQAYGPTGIEVALRAAVADLPPTGSHTILLISDGEETCDGEPCAAAADLLATNIRFIVNTVGFQTADTPAEQQLQCIADATGGTMTPVADLPDLLETIQDSIDPCVGSLILCYAPEVRFHPNERYYPMDPAVFVEGSELQWVHAANGRTRACFRDEIIDDDPEPDFLGQPVYFAQQQEFSPVLWNPRRCKRFGKRYSTVEFTRPYSADPSNRLFDRAVDNSGVTLDLEEGFELLWTDYGLVNVQLEEPDGLHNDPGDGMALSVPMYAQLVETGPERFIVYHMFYGFDPKSQVDLSDFNATQLGDQLLAHEGDWERIIVVLGPDDVPTEVRFLGHGCEGPDFEQRNFAPWSTRLTGSEQNVQAGRMQVVDGTHPVVYVAEGSHASYPHVRPTGLEACLTKDGQPSGVADQTMFDDTSVTWRPWTSGDVVDPQTECWYGYGGSWGRGGNLDFGIGAPIDLPGDKFDLGELRTHDTGPVGPHYNVNLLPEGNQCADRRLDVRVASDEVMWGEQVQLTLTGYAPGTPVLISLASLETGVATGTVGAGGSLAASFAIPDGFGPGGHRIIIRAQSSGEILAVDHVNVTVPEDCLAPGIDPVNDTDGDNVANSCDLFPDDGPVADADGDGVINFDDNCPTVPNPDQAAKGRASVGTACNIDSGYNPAAIPLAAFNGAVPPSGPPISSPNAAEPADYEPPMVAPAPPEGPYGFGTPPNPVASTPLPTVDPVPAHAPRAAASSGEIAHTGVTTRPLAMAGLVLLMVGSYAIALARIERRNRTRLDGTNK